MWKSPLYPSLVHSPSSVPEAAVVKDPVLPVCGVGFLNSSFTLCRSPVRLDRDCPHLTDEQPEVRTVRLELPNVRKPGWHRMNAAVPLVLQT